jgi:hypothetical protein
MDSPTDPLNGLVAGESYGALALEVSFVDPRMWADDVTPDGDVDRALDTWRDSWDLLPVHAAEVREAVYPVMVEAFAPQMSTEELGSELGLLDEALRRASAIADVAWPSHVVSGLALAGSSRDRARAAFAVGDLHLALLHLMRGGDALRTVGPEAVARSLVAEAQALHRRVSEDDPYTQEDLERLGRLEVGARQALAAEDWALAIRRAYYARGILLGNE